ncbi:hypothetical protein MSLAZ_1310 [Methanosarcina lacustris Z-7289]|uniref:Uncharacterized protein n=1 Tax=Methanosarcina lacustris Z-7289 TaxID=1434111 RepID=A0A0E3S330_9EURY|nr:hypothetical protein [Methanosarcina lacustris]AKB74571.1 hypothetical protein MSLAZ_1310 [Methanosarcina lacustris Z-7289]
MIENKLSGTRIQNAKNTAYIRLRPVSRICSLSQLIRSRPASEDKTSNFTKNEALDVETHQNEEYDTVVHKTIAFYLPSLIRIRATDRDGNSIEVTY